MGVCRLTGAHLYVISLYSAGSGRAWASKLDHVPYRCKCSYFNPITVNW